MKTMAAKMKNHAKTWFPVYCWWKLQVLVPVHSSGNAQPGPAQCGAVWRKMKVVEQMYLDESNLRRWWEHSEASEGWGELEARVSRSDDDLQCTTAAAEPSRSTCSQSEDQNPTARLRISTLPASRSELLSMAAETRLTITRHRYCPTQRTWSRYLRRGLDADDVHQRTMNCRGLCRPN